MTDREDQQNAAKGSSPDPSASIHGAALAAKQLEDACESGAGDPLRLEIVRTLTRELMNELETLAVMADGLGVVEGALRAADVANLAACTAPDLHQARAMEAAAAAHLAAGAARALCILAEASVVDTPGEYAQNALKDVQGALWRARLAARQVDEFLGETV